MFLSLRQDVGKLEVLCLVAAIVLIAIIVLYTDLTKTPEKLTKQQQQQAAYQKVLEKARARLALMRLCLFMRPRSHAAMCRW